MKKILIINPTCKIEKFTQSERIFERVDARTLHLSIYNHLFADSHNPVNIDHISIDDFLWIQLAIVKIGNFDGIIVIGSNFPWTNSPQLHDRTCCRLESTGV